jgi:hypothetical protein
MFLVLMFILKLRCVPFRSHVRSEVVKIASIGMNQPCKSGAVAQLRAMEFVFLDKA